MSGSRFERELEELLVSLGEWTPRESRSQRFRRRFRAWLYRWQEAIARMRWGGLPADQMMLVGMVLIVFAYFLRLALPAGAAYVGLLGVLLFFVAFALAVTGGRRRRDIRWRGHLVEPSPYRSSPPPFLAWLRRWWRRRTWR
ncbi:MAG: hypothetical protein HY689_10170 [Chloroflexi bacterium]|nr:hypothetical protein [Chloroflexota bacterium]